MEFATASPATWAELASDNFISVSICDTDDRFEAALRACDLGGAIRLTAVRTSRGRVRRGLHDVRVDACNDLLMLAPLSGSTLVRQEGSQVQVTPGAVSVHVAERPYELVFDEPSRMLVLQAPRRIVPSSALVSAERRRVAASGAAARIFKAFAAETIDVAAALSEHERDALGAVAAALAVSVLDGVPAQQDAADPRRTLLVAAQAHIRNRLHDPGLSPAAVAAHHRVSLRALQHAFADAGSSPAAFIRTERLQRARRALAAPQRARSGIAVVAAEVGYADVDVFTRAFRREFGETPGAWRSRRTPTPSES